VSFKKSNVIFYSIMLGALLLAPAQAFVLAQTVQSAEAIALSHPLRLNESLLIDAPSVISLQQGNF
jgi:hypothetical protein